MLLYEIVAGEIPYKGGRYFLAFLKIPSFQWSRGITGLVFQGKNTEHPLVGGLEHLDYFPYIGNVIIPTDELIFFRRVAQPPTSPSF